MPLADTLYDWLEHAPTEAADHVLAAGLDQAEPEYAARIIAILLKRGNEASLGGLIGELDRLPADVQAQVLDAATRVPAAMGVAMRLPSARARMNAMATLESVPTPRMSYLLPYALRDGSSGVRDAAVRAGRTIAETFLDRPAPTNVADRGEARRLHAVERGQLVQALREIARTYDRHFRLELLEVCLWFADDLEGDIWKLLGSRRSNSGRAVQEHLAVWNTPRLASFLLQCLGRDEWRRAAQLLLRSWSTPDEAAALLRRVHVLDNEDIRRGLAGVNRPRWFAACGHDLEKLPAEVRSLAPRWIGLVGLTADQKVNQLSSWTQASFEPLRRAAVYALASLDSHDARSTLMKFGNQGTRLGTFARWVLAGWSPDAVSVRAPILSATSVVSGAAEVAAVPVISEPVENVAPAPLVSSEVSTAPLVVAAPTAPQVALATGGDAAESERYFGPLWAACRSTTGPALAELIGALQDNADLFERPLRETLGAGDARDRLLALRIVGTRRHARRFVKELEARVQDDVPAIRGLTQTILQSAREALPSPIDVAAAATTDAGDARRELDALVADLSTASAAAVGAESASRIRALLRTVRVRDAADSASDGDHAAGAVSGAADHEPAAAVGSVE